MQAQPPSVPYIDSHTHLLDYPSQQATHEVILNAHNRHVEKIVANTTSTAQFEDMRALVGKWDGVVVGGFGVHPCYVGRQEQINGQRQAEGLASWEGMLQECVGTGDMHTVGEIGLDFRKDVLEQNPKELQMKYFLTQLQLAMRLHRPATIHCMLKILKDLNKTHKYPTPNLIMHSYGGSPEITLSMLKLSNLNIYFSLSLRRSEQLCKVIPVDRLLCETDSPCQNNPALLAQQGRLADNIYCTKIKQNIEKEQDLHKMDTNEPANVIANVKSLFKYYGMSDSKFTQIVYENTLRAFKLLK